eukprot:TRINITY_DN6216_c0_g1_i1.p1 TRINITY_DN6216_c0_g1~~TRINITY_DN6216_c0_g1_i1.p1  ORF type:complete len:522 (+),score=65.35 TRINITY_DN6216_c0_g1_i1:34-1566(+)
MSLSFVTTLSSFVLHACVLAARQSPDITFYVRNQNTAIDNAAFDEIREAVMKGGWPHDSVVSMVDAEREYRHDGLWSYLPWIYLAEQKRAEANEGRRTVGRGERWAVFLEPSTGVDVNALAKVLAGFDSKEPFYIGRALRDEEYSIIHHYQLEPAYPLVHAGFALSAGALRKIYQNLKADPLTTGQQIEPVWEVADYLNKKFDVQLTNRSDAFCLQKEAGCATWVKSMQKEREKHSRSLQPHEVVIAVKTVAKFHEDRIPLMRDFWASQSNVPVFFMSNEDYGPPGANNNVVNLTAEYGDWVDPAIESTPGGSGHCTKMHAILKWLGRSHLDKRWFVVTDDDTLLNVPQLLKVLDSHDDSKGQKSIYLGERYGWAHREERSGTNYITTGGGMALSKSALMELAQCTGCFCDPPNTPDDMSLGQWFRSLDVAAIHEEGFHQSEPHNYHEEVLRASQASQGPPVSFHRFGARLPPDATKDEVEKVRRENWKSWVETHFQQKLDAKEGKASEL